MRARFSHVLDSQKFTAIDSDIRVTLDYIFFKSLGIAGLIDEWRFLYSTYRPLSLQKMANKYFLLLTRAGSHGIGSFEYHSWHKVPGEPLLLDLVIETSFEDELIETKDSHRVGDLLHAEIIRLRNEGNTYKQIADKKGLSSATPRARSKIPRSHHLPAYPAIHSARGVALPRQPGRPYM